MAEIKDKEKNLDSESDYENNGKRQIIDVDPTAIVATAAIQPEEPTDPEEGSAFFIHRCGWKGPHCILLLIAEARGTSSQ